MTKIVQFKEGLEKKIFEARNGRHVEQFQTKSENTVFLLSKIMPYKSNIGQTECTGVKFNSDS